MPWLQFDIGPAAVIFGDRTGGVSDPPFDSANAGYLTGDNPGHVAENRRRLGAALGGAAADASSWTRLRQVHGATVVGPEGIRDQVWRAAREPVDADAAVTDRTDVTLAVLTADCGPVAVTGSRTVALAHAGWRGVERGVLAATVAAVRTVDDGDLHAVIGPLARPCCYEFGAADLDHLSTLLGASVRATTTTGRPALDLAAAVTAALVAAGVDPVNVRDTGVCTICSPNYFSHRRDGRLGPTGRQASLAVLR